MFNDVNLEKNTKLPAEHSIMQSFRCTDCHNKETVDHEKGKN